MFNEKSQATPTEFKTRTPTDVSNKGRITGLALPCCKEQSVNVLHIKKKIQPRNVLINLHSTSAT
jgi:hypothetical protein